MNSDAVSLAGGAALLDVAAALRWTRANVPAFGGDPARVTLAGHAAGAALASALLMLPDTKGEPSPPPRLRPSLTRHLREY